MSDLELSVTIPVYNEADQLARSIKEVNTSLQRLGRGYEIIIADDGSIDDTSNLAQSLLKKYPQLRYVRNETNWGRGEAVSKAFMSSSAKILIFMDCDLSTDLKYLGQLIKSIGNGADVSTGSRWLPESKVKRNPTRLVISFIYNNLVRLLFGSKVRDHQCGFKAFKREVAIKLISEAGIRSDRLWAWDVEMLVRAQRHKLKIVEFPIVWNRSLKTTTKFLRDSVVVGLYLIKLRLKLWGFKL